MKNFVIYFLQSTLLIVITPLFIGLLKNIKAYLRGYKGPGLFQQYYDLARLLGKGRVISSSSSFITQIGPVICLAAAVACAYIIPIFFFSPKVHLGNIFVIIFLLGVIKFLNSLLGLDSASTFGGMGSSRELFISMLAEPVMFVVITFLYLETKTFNINEIALINSSMERYSVGHIIAAFAFFILILIENARMPVDNPETHLELTMVHEAMILEMSGRDLAFIELSSYIKIMIFLTLFINGFASFGAATTLSIIPIVKALIIYAVKIIFCLLVISLTEVNMAKFRLFRIPELTAAAFSISILAITINYFI